MSGSATAVGRPALSDGTVRGVGDVRLAYRAWEVVEPRAAIIAVHGIGEHGGRYRRFAASMAAAGCSTFAIDLRGHGRSEGRRGHAPRFGCFLQDVDRFRREVQGLVASRTPLFLFGHSMGGLIALRYLQEFDAPFRGVVVSAPWLATARPLPRWMRSLAHALDRVLPALPLRTTVRPEHLSHDAEVVRAYREDPAVHRRITPRLFAEVERAAEAVFGAADELTLPMLLLLAGDDRIVSTGRAIELARALDRDGSDVTVRRYAGYFHEVLNEIDPAPVVRDVRDWIAALAG